MRLALTALILTILWSGTAFAQLMPGDALVIDPSVGTGRRGALFSVDQTTGDRTIISDFGLIGEGPLGGDPTGVTLDGSGNALVIDQSAGTSALGARALGALFSVDLTPGPTFGDRTIISDFGNGAQGPLGVAPRGVTLDGSGDALVIDPDAGTDGDGALGDGALFRVDLTTGDRTIISDFGNGAQGPLGVDPMGVTLDGSGNALVIDQSAGTGFKGALFRVDLATGQRTIVSDFGNGAQGPTGVTPEGVTLEDSNNALVIDQSAGPLALGALFRVDLATGQRTIVSDFGNGAQGPTGVGVGPRGVTLDGSGDAPLVIDPNAGTSALGALFSVDLTPGPTFGDRTIISDFGDGAPFGSSPFDVIIFSIADLAVVKSGFPDPVIVGGSLAYTIL